MEADDGCEVMWYLRIRLPISDWNFSSLLLVSTSGYDKDFKYTLAGQGISFSLKGSDRTESEESSAGFHFSTDLSGHAATILLGICVLMDWPATSMLWGAGGLFEMLLSCLYLVWENWQSRNSCLGLLLPLGSQHERHQRRTNVESEDAEAVVSLSRESIT